jgi:L-alanine-DL-glutamate epimerase-like enolase superfamily enzyme
MVIDSINCYRLHIPFRTAFSHSSATRVKTQSLWVEITSGSGLTGYGESCPREYVTAETLTEAIAWIGKHIDVLIRSVQCLDDLLNFELTYRKEIDRNPAAWCALELALLDLIAKQEKQTIEALTGCPELSGSFRYSAVLGDADPARFGAQAQQYVKLGFRDFKVKLSGDLDRDAKKLAALREVATDKISIRLDANNLWSDPDEVIQAVGLLQMEGASLEEPLTPNQYQAMAEVAAGLGANIILDESFLREQQFEELAGNPGIWMINLRVSKMGGILRSLQIVEKARHIGIPIIIGAQVGETSLLTRAALTVAGAARDVLHAQEGAFGTYLLAEDICAPMLMFGKEGLLSFPAGQNRAYGFGLEVTQRKYLEPC